MKFSLCDESFLSIVVDLSIKKVVFLIISNKDLTLVENEHTKFKPESLDFQAEHLWCSLYKHHVYIWEVGVAHSSKRHTSILSTSVDILSYSKEKKTCLYILNRSFM
jgi:hypothetical protein